MKLIADMHTHTIASDHAYSTLYENILQAKKNGLLAICITDHSKSIKDGPYESHFKNLKVLPNKFKGVKIFKGSEVNIADFNGSLDMSIDLLKNLDFSIASFHDVVVSAGDINDHTNAYANIVKNPFIDCIGHSGNPGYVYDYEKVIALCKKYNKIIEINEGSFYSRKGSYANCIKILKLCNAYGVTICVNSDAHFLTAVGKFTKCKKMLKTIDFNKNLILNHDYKKLKKFILKRKSEKELFYKKIIEQRGYNHV